MKTLLVKDLMVPLSGYATVSKEATLYDAILALEKAQEEFDRKRYRHRGILVYDENGKIMGKISQTAILRALEPKYEQFEMPRSRYPFAPNFMKSIFSQYDLWNKPLDDICKKAFQKRVKEFVEHFDESEIVQEETSLNEAIHILVVGQLQSLLVVREGEVSGILRLTDVFHEVLKMVKSCELQQ
jgi:CBS domain-containing protein